MEYIRLSPEIEREIIRRDGEPIKALRRDMSRDRATAQRPAYIRDVEKILNHPYYNRYSDKTQVFSFYKNDDITRRGLHVQLVSRIGRNIGRLLGLNCDLIEAIALGHDLGHTPFGHAGERFLNEIYHRRTGLYFRHNIHSVRVLDDIFRLNISLNVLSGILCHNGELELGEYRPRPLSGFEEFDEIVRSARSDNAVADALVANTLEGCVVRVSDIIAYVGKDRQDAERAGIRRDEGDYNARFINNIVVNLVENSFGKDYLKMEDKYFRLLYGGKRDNYESIYGLPELKGRYDREVRPLFEQLYDYLLTDLAKGDGLVQRHHIKYVNRRRHYYGAVEPYEKTSSPDDIVADYIASMTDDYFIDLCARLFDGKISYVGYFDGLDN